MSQIWLTGSGRYLLPLMLAAVLWGSVPIATNALYQITTTTPLSIGFWRLLLSLPVLLPLALHGTARAHWQIPRRDWLFLFLFGAGMAGYQVCYFAAVARIGVTLSALVALPLVPVMVALAAALLLGERPSRRVLLAMGAAIVGTLLLSGGRPTLAVERTTVVVGLLLAVGAAASFATVTLSTRALTGRYRSLQLIAISMTIATLLLLPFVFWQGVEISYPPAGWLLLLHLGLVPTVLGYILFFYGMRHTTATVASIVNLLEPLTSALLAWLLFAERLGLAGFLGAILLLTAMALLAVPVRLTLAGRNKKGTAGAVPESRSL